MDETPPSNGRRVLVINDTSEIAELIELILNRTRGDEVIGVASGHEGIAVAQDVLPDLIILDIMMPYPDGFDTYRQIKAIPSLQGTPILFTDGGDKSAGAKQIGGMGFLAQPFTPSTLLAARDTVLSGSTYYPLPPIRD